MVMEKTLANIHRELLTEICIQVKNCADCHGGGCHPERCLYDVICEADKHGIWMDPYGEKTNRKLEELAGRCGYWMKEETDATGTVTGLAFIKSKKI